MFLFHFIYSSDFRSLCYSFRQRHNSLMDQLNKMKTELFCDWIKSLKVSNEINIVFLCYSAIISNNNLFANVVSFFFSFSTRFFSVCFLSLIISTFLKNIASQNLLLVTNKQQSDW